jgi:DNA-binding MarR family transcriptional regulator
MVNRGGQQMQPEDAKGGGSQDSWLSETDASIIFGPLHDERLRIDRIVSRLDVTDDLVERADLASELVRSVSRYEDTIERSLFVRLTESTNAVLEELDRERDQLRETMTVIHERTMGIDPRNVHASDGQGFEDTLEDVVHRLRALLLGEDRQIAALMGSLGPEDRQQLSEDIAHTFRSASERPHPPHTAVGRFFSNAHVKLDHTFEDVATPSHPGSDTING